MADTTAVGLGELLTLVEHAAGAGEGEISTENYLFAFGGDEAAAEFVGSGCPRGAIEADAAFRAGTVQGFVALGAATVFHRFSFYLNSDDGNAYSAERQV